MRQAFIGIDVGTSSARAGVFDEKGSLLATARHPITVWHEAGNVVEQSSSEIWAACAAAVRTAMVEAAIPPSAVKGLGFDATCSLVVLDAGANPLTVSGSGDERRNVIVWMDHRAIAQARQINDTHDDVLRYVGGSISPEMELPKLLWLKQHLPSTYHSAGHFFDLADYLSFRATGSAARSMCTVACKWNFLAHEQRWSCSYFERIGLGDLASDKYARIGKEIGAAIDHLIRSHPAYNETVAAAHAAGMEILEYLERRIVSRSASSGAAALFARDIHVLPEFLGNRSPFADPDAHAVVAGMDLEVDVSSMERLFVAGLCGLAYGLADVVEAFRSHGVGSDLMVISGGAGRSSLVRQIMADTTALTVAVPQTQEPVLLGAAMLGAVAGNVYGSIGEPMGSMSAIGCLSEKTAPGMADFHRIKREVHGLMRKLDRESRDAMHRIGLTAGVDAKN